MNGAKAKQASHSSIGKNLTATSRRRNRIGKFCCLNKIAQLAQQMEKRCTYSNV
jgi:hypothetical protein